MANLEGSAAVEHTINPEQKRRGPEYSVVCAVELSTGEYVCILDTDAQPPVLKPLQIESDDSFVPARTVIDAYLGAYFNTEELTDRDAVPLYREYIASPHIADQVADQTAHEHSVADLSLVETRVYDVHLSPAAEACLRKSVSRKNSPLVLIPKAAVRKIAYPTFIPSSSNLSVTETSDWHDRYPVPAQLEEPTVQVDVVHGLVQTTPSKEPADQFLTCHIDSQLQHLLRSEVNLPLEIILEKRDAAFSAQMAESVVRMIEQVDRNIEHKLTLADVDKLALIIDDQELVQKLRKVLIISRLEGYLAFRVGQSILEGTVLYGNLIQGVQADISAITAHIGTVFLTFKKELGEDATESSLEELLQEVLDNLAENYDFEITSDVIPDLKEWDTTAKDIAQGERYYSGLAELTPAMLSHSTAFVASGHWEWAASYAGLMLTVKAMEQLSNKTVSLGKNMRKSIEVVLRTLPETFFVVFEKLFPGLKILESAGLLVPLLMYNLSHLLPQFEGKQTITSAKHSMTELRKVLNVLVAETLSLPTQTQYQLFAFEQVVNLEHKRVDFSTLIPHRMLFADENQRQEEIVNSGSLSLLHEQTTSSSGGGEVSFFDFRKVVNEGVSAGVIEQRQVLKAELLDAVYDQILSMSAEGIDVNRFDQVCLSLLQGDGERHQASIEQQLQILLVGLEDPSTLENWLLENETTFSVAFLQQLLEALHANNPDAERAAADEEQSQLERLRIGTRFKRCMQRIRNMWVRSSATESTRPYLKKYLLLDGIYGDEPVAAPVFAGFQYDIATSSRVFIENSSLWTEAGKVTILKDANKIILKALADKINHQNGTGFIRMPGNNGEDYSLQRDVAREKITYAEFSKEAVKRVPSYALDEEYLKQTGLFSDEEIQEYSRGKRARSRLVGGMSGTRLKLLIAEACQTDAPVIILSKMLEHDLSHKDQQLLAVFLHKLAQQKAVICDLDSGHANEAVGKMLERADGSKTYVVDKKRRAFVPLLPTESELLGMLDMFKIPYDQEQVSPGVPDEVEGLVRSPRNADIVSVREWCELNDRDYAPMLKNPAELLQDVLRGETQLHIWTVDDLYEQVENRNIEVLATLPPRDNREILVRETENVTVKVTYEQPDGEKLFLVEFEQEFVNVEGTAAKVDASGERVKRRRHDVIGISEKYSPVNKQQAVDGALYGLRDELSIYTTPDQLLEQGSKSELKFSATYQCPNILNTTTYELRLSQQQAAKLCSGPITDSQKGKSTTFIFIPESKLSKYIAGEIEMKDQVLIS